MFLQQTKLLAMIKGIPGSKMISLILKELNDFSSILPVKLCKLYILVTLLTIYFQKMLPPCSEGRKLLVRICTEISMPRIQISKTAWRNMVVSKIKTSGAAPCNTFSNFLPWKHQKIDSFSSFWSFCFCMRRPRRGLPSYFFVKKTREFSEKLHALFCRALILTRLVLVVQN